MMQQEARRMDLLNDNLRMVINNTEEEMWLPDLNRKLKV